MGSHEAAVYCDNRSYSICLSPGANPRFCNWQKTPPPMITVFPPCFTVYSRLQFFHQIFADHRHSYLTLRFRILIRQCKRLYFTGLLSRLLGKRVAPSPTPWCSSYRKRSFRVTLGRQLYFYLLSSLCVPWHIGAFFEIFLLPQQWYLERNSAILNNFTESSLHSRCWYIFFHDIGSVVQWYLQQSAFCHTKWRLWRNSPLFLLLLLVYLPNLFCPISWYLPTV